MADNNKTTVGVDLEANSAKAQAAVDALIARANQGVQRMQALEQSLQKALNTGSNVNPAIERAERQAIAGRDRRQAFGGAALLGAQSEVLRNYAVLGAGIGAGGFLGNFAVQAERELANLQAISQATAGEMANLTKGFEALAQQSKYAFQEIAAGSVVLAQAGFSAQEIEQMLQSITRLATATGTELSTAVDIATSVLSVFHLQASETSDVVDLLTEAMNRSKLNMEQFRLAIQYSGNIAAEQGVGVRELTAAFAAMADQGIRSGSTLGTGLRQLLIDLADPTEDARRHFEAFGLSMQDIDIRANGLTGVLRNLRDAGFTSAEGFQTFETRAAAAFAALEANPDAISDLMEDLNGTGAASRAAATQMDTLSARFTQFGNAAGVSFTRIMEPLIDVLKDVLVNASALLSIVGQFAPVFSAAIPVATVLVLRQLGQSFAGLVTGILAYSTASTASATATAANNAALAGFRTQVVGAAAPTTLFSIRIASATAGLTGFSAAAAAAGAAAGAAATSLRALALAALANPFTALVTVITTLVTATSLWDAVTKDAAERADELATRAADLGGELQTTQQEMERVSNEIERLSERSAGLATANLSAEERQAALNEIVVESIGNVDGLSEALDGQVSSIEQVQRALRGLQIDLIETAQRQAELLDVTLRQQAIEEGRSVEEGFDSFRGSERRRSNTIARNNGSGLPQQLLPQDVAQLYQQFVRSDTFNPEAQRSLERALTSLSRSGTPEQQTEANRILREMGDRYLAPLARQLEAQDQAERNQNNLTALNISSRLAEPLEQLTTVSRQWNEEIARLRDSGLTGNALNAAERQLAQRPEFANAATQFNEAVQAQREIERQRLQREGRTEEQIQRELARTLPMVAGVREALNLAGEVRSAGRTERPTRTRTRRGPSATLDLARAVTSSEDADVDAVLSSLRDINIPELVQAARESFEEQWTEYVEARTDEFEAEWASKDYSDPNQAALRDLARESLQNELATTLEDNRRRFDQALADAIKQRMDAIIGAAQREFESAVDASQFRLDQLDGLANRGRFGDARRGVEERRAEEARVSALPALIATYNEQIALARSRMDELAAEADATTDVSRARAIEAALQEAQRNIRETKTEHDAIQRELDANTQRLPETQVGSAEWMRQTHEAVTLWAEAAGVMRDASDMATEAIVDAFDTMHSSLKEAIKGILDGTMSVEDAVRSMVESVLESLFDMAVEMLTNEIIAYAIQTIGGMIGGGTSTGSKGTTGGSKPVTKGKAQGGMITGGTPGRDSVHIKAMPGEYMIKKSAADMIGRDTLDRMNNTGRVAGSGVTGVVPMAIQREPDMTQVWVVSPDQVPPMGPKDIVVAIQRDVSQGGPIKKMIKQVAMGA